MIRKLIPLLVVFGLAATNAPTYAQIAQPDETLPGFRAQDVLFSGTYDNVNAYNGDDGVVVPLGPSYPLGKDFTFQVRAFNTLKFWSLEDGDTCEMWDGSGPKDVTKAFIAGFPTIGAAWTLSSGYVTDDLSPSSFAYVYVSPDGGHHPMRASDGLALDGSRLKIVCQGSPWTSCTVNFPDGTQQVFSQLLSDPVPIAGSSPDFSLGQVSRVLGLTQVNDAWSRVLLTIQYGTNYAPSWGVGRIFLGTTSAPAIVFNWFQNGLPVAGGVTWPAVSSITFPTINGSPAETATFTYDTTHTVTRSAADTTLQTAPCPCQASESDPAVAYVHQVTKIALANGSTPAATFTMAYADTGHSGGLTNLTLPMGGQITYTLGVAQHPDPDSTWPDTTLETSDRGGLAPGGPPLTPGCPPNHLYISDVLGNAMAVIQRDFYDPVMDVTSTTTYDRLDNVPLTYPGTNTGQGYNTRIVEVTEPRDSTNFKLTRYLFHIPNAGQNDPSVSGVELEHSVYLGSSFSGSGAIRTTINCEDKGSTAGFCGYLSSSGGVNQFPTSEGNLVHSAGHVTWYGDKPTNTLTDKSGGTCPSGAGTQCVADKFTSPADWVLSNGYHYRTETITSANTTPTINRTITTTWAPWTMSGSCLNTWALDLFSQRVTTDSGAPAPNSVTTTYAIESCKPFYTSSATADSTYGTLNVTDTDSGLGKGTPITRYGSGVTAKLASTVFSDAITYDGNIHPLTVTRSPFTWKSFDVSRDLSTGLITSSRDPNGLQTAYTYDGLGRLLTVQPPGTATSTQYCYYLATDGLGGNPYGVNIAYEKQGTTNVCSSVESSSTLTWRAYQYDGAGRVIREYQLLPNDAGSGSNFSFRDSKYDAAGNKTFFSEWTPCIPNGGTNPMNIGYCAIGVGTNSQFATHGTSYTGFDVFGRPAGANAITRADGTTTTISYTDGSTACSDLYESVSVNNVGGAAATTVTRKDPLGRVYSVQEPAVGGIADTTTYAYNVLDKVASVTQGVQTRSFVYDKNAFLRSETNPEQTGATLYNQYDALGDVLSKTEGTSPSQITSTSSFDQAGRLLSLLTSEGRTYVQNTYDTNTLASPPSPNYPKGRLTQRIGWNFPLDPGPKVQEDFGYGGSTNPQGQLSMEVTTVGSDSDTADGTGVRDGESLQVTETWTYNGMGLVSGYNHPRVAPTTYAEAVTYGAGRPTLDATNGTNVASNVWYHASGSLLSWLSGNSITTTIQESTSTLMPRPTSITTSSGGLSLSSYAYDGAGNITAIGTDTFKYDARSRLVSADYGYSSPSCTDSLGNANRDQCFAYDRYGNLTNVAGTNPRTLTTSTATNHLTGQTYDTRGNIINTQFVDGLNRITNGGNNWLYLYNGAGERVAKFPDNNILRREMAKVIIQARGEAKSTTGCYPSNPAVDNYYDDVACTDPDRGWIDKANEDGIAQGYGNRTYGPQNPVSRDQMAKFIVAGRNEQPVPSGQCDPNNLTFSDVLCTNGFWGYIQQIYNDGITSGCGVDGSGHLIYCPSNNVPESQMMAFTRRGWPSYLYVPRGTIYTFRDAGDRVATEFLSTPGSTSYPVNDFPVASTVTRDNVFLGSLLVGSYCSNALGGNTGWSYYHSDHLGTPRLVTGAEGPALLKYWPYGDEVTGIPVTSERLKFATMERDTENNHFFDHARHHDFNLGRFVSVDTLGGIAEEPKSWNRYAYAGGNPLSRVDATGRTDINVFVQREIESEFSTIGSFSVDDGAVRGVTLELPDRDNAAGRSRIPAGDYSAVRFNSPKDGKVLRLLAVPGRSLINIHSGNVPGNSLGCILVGTACTGPDFISGSKEKMAELIGYVDKIRDSDRKKKEKTRIFVHIRDIEGDDEDDLLTRARGDFDQFRDQLLSSVYGESYFSFTQFVSMFPQ